MAFPPVLSKKDLIEWDSYTIESQKISSLDLMENAVNSLLKYLLAEEILTNFNHILVLCGPGNNGGDGFLLAQKLQELDHDVTVFTHAEAKFSQDAEHNLSKFKQKFPNKINDLSKLENLELTQEFLVIDCLFGYGLNREIGMPYSLAIDRINAANVCVISVDLPSGLTTEIPTNGSIMRATLTPSFEVPKPVLLYPSNAKFTGKVKIIHIPLDQEFLVDKNFDYQWMTRSGIVELIQRRNASSHKGHYGHCLLIGGSKGSYGALLLMALAAARSGLGKLTLMISQEKQDFFYEQLPIAQQRYFEDFDNNFDFSPYDAIAVGPGLGTDLEQVSFIQNLLSNSEIPLIMDADALNIVAEKSLLKLLPQNSILTPHVKEFHRLFGQCDSDEKRLQKQKEMSLKHSIYIILKGRFSSISTPQGKVYFNSTGNSGMATGGSGDVLTGILAGLFSQGYSSIDTALIGTFVHGMSGDLAAKKFGEMSMISSDIIEHIADFLRDLYIEKTII